MEAKIARLYTQTIFLDIQRIVDKVDAWSQNYTTRKELRDLGDHQLADIGIDRISAQRESNKPFWQD